MIPCAGRLLESLGWFQPGLSTCYNGMRCPSVPARPSLNGVVDAAGLAELLSSRGSCPLETVMATMLIIVRKCIAVAIISAGLLLLYYACWILSNGIWPQWRESGWSLTGSSTILNREWHGNELYLLVSLYCVIGFAATTCGLFVWKKPLSRRNRIDSVAT